MVGAQPAQCQRSAVCSEADMAKLQLRRQRCLLLALCLISAVCDPPGAGSNCATEGDCADTCATGYGSCGSYYYCCDKSANCTGHCPCGGRELQPVEHCCCNPTLPPVLTPAPTPAYPDPRPPASPVRNVTLSLSAWSAVIENGFVRVEIDIARPSVSALHADVSGNGRYNLTANVLARPVALETLLTDGTLCRQTGAGREGRRR